MLRVEMKPGATVRKCVPRDLVQAVRQRRQNQRMPDQGAGGRREQSQPLRRLGCQRQRQIGIAPLEGWS